MAVVFLGWVAVREGSIIRSELQLLRAARQSPGDPRPTQDTEAYEHYLKARQKFRPYSPEPDQMVEALSLATRAVERDPQFAQAQRAHRRDRNVQRILEPWLPAHRAAVPRPWPADPGLDGTCVPSVVDA
jgi:hypothetical protein